jgi:anti-sigma factor RsiW
MNARAPPDRARLRTLFTLVPARLTQACTTLPIRKASMTASQDHDVEVLGIYTMGLLDDEQADRVEEHLAICDECCAVLSELVGVRELLAFTPASAFDDSTPVATVIPLRRRSWTRLAVVAAAVVAAFGLAVGGFVVGQRTSGDQLAAAPTSTPTQPLATPASGIRLASNTAPDGARLTVRLEPASGWVRINAAVAGLPEGVRCQVVVVSRTGQRLVAVSWVVSAKGAAMGTNLDGGVLLPADDVDHVTVESLDGEELVSAKV